MNQDLHSFSTQKPTQPIQVNLDEFNLDEASFKPMTKGLGFHHEQKKTSFKVAPKETKTFASAKTQPVLNSLSDKNTKTIATQHIPSGLEAFYGTQVKAKQSEIFEIEVEEKIESKKKVTEASSFSQFGAWIIDLLVIASFEIITGALLILASGIEFKVLTRLVSTQDLIAFSASIFSIYYLLYFTILDLSASPGKTLFGIKLIKSDKGNVAVKNTFTRALVSLLSAVALFLPMLLDFQGRLSDTKLVK
jgi:hypothetical protein